MPLSEFHRMAKGKLQSTQQRSNPYSADLSFAPDNDLVELVWENGQIVTQNQSYRTKRNQNVNILPSRMVKPRDRDGGNANHSKTGKLGTTDSALNDFSLLVPSAEMGLHQDEDMSPWFDYPISDSLAPEYCSEFLPEVSGLAVNEHSHHNNFASFQKTSNYSPAIRDSHDASAHSSDVLEQGGSSKVCYADAESSKLNHLYPSMPQHRGETPLPSVRPGLPEINANSTGNANRTATDTAQLPNIDRISSLNMETQASGLPRVSSGVINFSHFARPAVRAQSNLQGIDLLGTDKMGNKDKASLAGCSGHSGSVRISSSSGTASKMVLSSESSLVLPKVDIKSMANKQLHGSTPADQPDVVCQDDATNNDKSSSQLHATISAERLPDSERTIEPVVASSSVCSGNSMEGASNDPKQKRKSRENDESEGPSDDVEEESVGVRKTASARGGSSSKRSRAAEVHNLSERRRRDRINEKMRALQELIPNCNKVDKASMLDEAIEYLKTLQLQVQIMSMGAGLCMPPVMFPTGMQHMHPAHMSQFSHMGVGLGMSLGMGMGMGFGMGMIDTNGGASGFPMYQASSMQGAHFPAPPISAASNFHRITGPNMQLYGVPGQGPPMSMPHPPFVPMPGAHPVKSTTELNSSGVAGDLQVSDTIPSSCSKDNINSHARARTDPSWSANQISNQATNEKFAELALVQEQGQAPVVSGTDTVYPSSAACYDRQPGQQ